MRLLHVYSGNLWGGIERVLQNLAAFQALQRSAAAPQTPPLEQEFALCFPGSLAANLRAAGAVCHQLGAVRFRYPWSVWLARLRLLRLLRRGGFDAVLLHASWSYAALAPAVERAGLPLLWAATDVVAGKHWLDRRVMRNPPRLVLANSGFTASAWRRLLPGSLIEVWYPPSPAAKLFDPNERAVQRLRWQTQLESRVILMASRLEAWKGHGVLLEALAALPAELDWTAWIAGEAQRPAEQFYLRQLKMQAERLGVKPRLRWLGLRHDLGAVMAAADVFCQPNSAPEPFGLSGIEALSAGLPIMASAMGGPAEILADGATGVLVPPNQPAALAGALRQLLLDPERLRLLRRQGPLRARQLCDPAAQTARLYELLAPYARQRRAAASS